MVNGRFDTKKLQLDETLCWNPLKFNCFCMRLVFDSSWIKLEYLNEWTLSVDTDFYLPHFRWTLEFEMLSKSRASKVVWGLWHCGPRLTMARRDIEYKIHKYIEFITAWRCWRSAAVAGLGGRRAHNVTVLRRPRGAALTS